MKPGAKMTRRQVLGAAALGSAAWVLLARRRFSASLSRASVTSGFWGTPSPVCAESRSEFRPTSVSAPALRSRIGVGLIEFSTARALDIASVTS